MSIKQLIHDVKQVLTTNPFAFKEKHGFVMKRLSFLLVMVYEEGAEGGSISPPPPNFSSGNFLAKNPRNIRAKSLDFRESAEYNIGARDLVQPA